jgi:hypothetical protein
LIFTIVPDCLNRTAENGFFTLAAFFFSFRLFINKRVVIFVATLEIPGRGIATNITINTGRVNVVSARDILFYFFVSVGHLVYPQITQMSQSRKTRGQAAIQSMSVLSGLMKSVKAVDYG